MIFRDCTAMFVQQWTNKKITQKKTRKMQCIAMYLEQLLIFINV